MTPITQHKADDYPVTEKIGRKAQLHIFESREQFLEWRKLHPTVKVKVGRARAKMISSIDHRGEFLL